MSLKKELILNTATNYAVFISTILSGLLTTRFLYLGLGESDYGFWVLLWAVFGYSILLDFGFGTSIQKYVAEYLISRDSVFLNRQINTVFFTYCAVASFLICIVFILYFFLSSIFSLPITGDIVEYRNTFLLFGLLTALLFPFGIFGEVLRGLGRNDLRNHVRLAKTLVYTGGVYYLMAKDFGLIGLTIFTLALEYGANIVYLIISLKKIPRLVISYSHFKREAVKEISSFSLYAYIITFTNMIIYRTDEILLGIMTNMKSVGTYRIGSRLSFMLDKMLTQFQDNLAPVAARFNASSEDKRLQNLLYYVNRYLMIPLLPATMFLLVLTEEILFVWLTVDNEIIAEITRILLVSTFLLILFRSATSKVLLMSGMHRTLAKISIVEALGNVALSVVFIKMYGIIGVCYGTLIPNCIVSIFIIFPMGARYCGLSPLRLIYKNIFPTVILYLPSLFLLIWLKEKTFLSNWSLFDLVNLGVLSSLLYWVLLYFLFLSSEEKEKIKTLCKKVMKRK